MILFVIIVLTVIILYYFTSNTFFLAFASKNSNNNSSKAAAPPSQKTLKRALQVYKEKNKSGKVQPTSNYKYLVDRGYLYFKNGTWYARNKPQGQPAAVPKKQQQPAANRPQNSGPLQGNQKPIVFKGENNPNPKKPVAVSVGGHDTQALLQYQNGGLKISPDGKSIVATIGPGTNDGAGNNQDRQRNEIAIKNLLGSKRNISFDLNVTGNVNETKNRIVNAFQIKPSGTGGDNAVLQVGVKDGKIAFRTNGNNSIKTNIDAGQAINVQIKTNPNNTSQLYINGKSITSFNMADKDANLKFGLEGSSRNSVNGNVTATYTNISIE